MTNNFQFSDDNKRYHTLAYHNKVTYGVKIFKATVDARCSCPNIDGSKGTGGCIFCDKSAGSALSVEEQFAAEKARIREKYPRAEILLYYGYHTNTYCTARRLKELLSEAERLGAFGASIATRPDCIDAEKARILAEFPLPLTVELGLQTVHDVTAQRINRCHTFAEFLSAFELLKELGIRVCVHIMNGLPGEDREMMLETARTVGRLHPNGVKIHLTHVLKGTRLCDMYRSGEYAPLGKDEYIDTVVRQLELLPADIVIERITGDGDKKLLAAPLWSMDKISVLGGVDKRMEELNTVQGKESEWRHQ